MFFDTEFAINYVQHVGDTFKMKSMLFIYFERKVKF